MQTLTLTPIGFLRTPKRVKFQAGHQPLPGDQDENLLELLPGNNFEQALIDIEGFERVWLLWWFHRNENWRPQVIPPRGPQKRRGLFATRSPHRPNALGMTPVRLLGVKGLCLRLGPCDLVDGTPIFDIKPYVPAYDSFPGSAAGWIDELDREEALPPAFQVSFAARAQEQARWLREGWAIDFTARVVELLSRDPSLHRTRRITRRTEDLRVMACGAWRAVFRVSGQQVLIEALEPGYPMSFLVREGYEEVPYREAQVAFYAQWPDAGPVAEDGTRMSDIRE
jgi:tRNA-Thr(GGU) m(6)t(6)A37 methyltransferase TsaA